MAGPIVRDHRTHEGGEVVVRDHRESAIQHVFVLMLENRSFDHMLGFSAIKGTDAASGAATTIHGLTGNESNSFNGQTYKVHAGAPNALVHDPGHDFPDVLVQLCGPGAVYPRGGAYPTPTAHNTGFVASYAGKCGKDDPGDIMKCHTPAQVPVLTALAREFAVCDAWHASIPGPTEPNRMFAMAGSSAGFDDSPTHDEMIEWELEWHGGLSFAHGNLFHVLDRAKVKRRIYAGDRFPFAAILKGISIIHDIREFEHFEHDIHDPKFDAKFVWIEPNYDTLNNDLVRYRDGDSQHPPGEVTKGEKLIKVVYEALRKSPIWDKSLLIVTWDEHGGFYDHVMPPRAAAPGDTKPGSKHNKHGFTFEQLGVRVPAVIVSPLIPRNLIDHRTYDHSSILATVEHLFKVGALTDRDAAANGVHTLATLRTARHDTPATLPAPAPEAMARRTTAAEPVAHPEASVNQGMLPTFVHSAMRQDLEVSPPGQRQAIITRVQSIKTEGEALAYMKEVENKVEQARRMAATA